MGGPKRGSTSRCINWPSDSAAESRTSCVWNAASLSDIQELFEKAGVDTNAIVEVEDAPHLASWNIDPLAYEAALIAFLDSLDG